MISGVSCSELPIHSAPVPAVDQHPERDVLHVECREYPASGVQCDGDVPREERRKQGGYFLLVFARDDHDAEFGA